MSYFYDLLRAKRNPFVGIDQEGFLLHAYQNTGDLTSMEKDIAEDIVLASTAILKSGLVAVFFRSCVAYDKKHFRLDMIIVVDQKDEGLAEKISRIFHQKSGLKFPSLKLLNLEILSRNEIKSNRYLQFVIKILSLRVYGEALERKIAKFKPGHEVCHSLKVISNKFELIRKIPELNTQERKQWCRHLAKHLIRAGFELVCTESKGFTRDLELCIELFTAHNPEYAHLLAEINEYLDENSGISESIFLAKAENLISILLKLAKERKLIQS